MNAIAFASFAAEYRRALRERVEAGEYQWPVENCDIVADRMLEGVKKQTASFDGPAFKLTCKRLGIKHTRKAVHALLGIGNGPEVTP